MSLSLKFKHICENTVKLLIPILTNQNILRYITYLTDDPLALQTYDRQGQLANQPDITDDLIANKSILLTPYDNTILTDFKVKVFINPLKGNPTKPISDDMYEIDILCPLNFWVLEGQAQFRPYMIAFEIAQMLDNQYEIAGVGKVEIVDWFRFKANDNYAGLSLILSVSSATLRN